MNHMYAVGKNLPWSPYQNRVLSRLDNSHVKVFEDQYDAFRHLITTNNILWMEFYKGFENHTTNDLYVSGVCIFPSVKDFNKITSDYSHKGYVIAQKRITFTSSGAPFMLAFHYPSSSFSYFDEAYILQGEGKFEIGNVKGKDYYMIYIPNPSFYPYKVEYSGYSAKFIKMHYETSEETEIKPGEPCAIYFSRTKRKDTDKIVIAFDERIKGSFIRPVIQMDKNDFNDMEKDPRIIKRNKIIIAVVVVIVIVAIVVGCVIGFILWKKKKSQSESTNV
ncbi:hypothetical protein TVAG_429800 [Trichomonas vaginalis G3]|uniref:Uncharacterized protein n=1 Tax=Trichomonas vaginalis (strain ATCC PRA-98 / G3) TaxID=412133 RepID=A2FKP0_TRIV3|nr:hypothetical protein TVAGG3_0403300 [Trichomonas vaginalis G3]EAX94538.1 hypothetical protein TVAG_429800 [Trichomonas vaginalis G3]KAI5534855.1 hypothetical protein TVAGG3_0403300 [Trichomonas vaginalis G3]|eukprot:XP_001307468.1 hypothetical protein [Trichomonas vaginalis G3]